MDKTSWVRLWNAPIPPKLKVFIWQVFCRILPTTEALIEKGAEVQPRCPVCWAAKETLEHLFFDCRVAQTLWGQAGLEYLGIGLSRHTFPMFLKQLLSRINQPLVFMAVAALLWRIWRSRNWVVFEGKQFGLPVLLRQYHQQVQEWIRLPLDPELGLHFPIPPPGQTAMMSSVTCMWDGATKSGSHAAGGIVLNDLEVTWCLELGFQEVCFQGDAQIIIDKVAARDVHDVQIGAVLEEIVGMFTNHSALQVRFVGRSNNR
ncbi:unnamed protein product, partial [Linum tenue]